MTADLPDDDDTLAALQALGLMEGDEGVAPGSQPRQNDAADALLADYREVAAALAWSVAALEPPPGLRARLLDRVREEARGPRHRGTVTLSPGVTLTLVDRIAWVESGIPGVLMKPLFVDRVHRYARTLVAMAPGAVYPCHRHAQVEELFMISGELTIAGHAVRPGDYLRSEASTLHGAVRSEAGCMFIALASLDDEVLTTP